MTAFLALHSDEVGCACQGPTELIFLHGLEERTIVLIPPDPYERPTTDEEHWRIIRRLERLERVRGDIP
jgi:hypothetical protein